MIGPESDPNPERSPDDGADERVRDLIDDYCGDLLDEDGVAELEAALLASPDARRYFVEYVQLHADLDFSARAGHAASAALGRIKAPSAIRSRRPGTNRRALAAAAAVIAAASYALGHWGWRSRLGLAPATSVAWLINAQDSRWASDRADSPGRDMVPGKVLRLERGLAEVEFESGARVILEGPSELELVSGNRAKLLRGSMTAKVPVRARGFAVVSPQGEVVDLGTEFGLAVDPSGTTSVRVFSGELTASAGPVGAGTKPVRLVEGQGARMDGQAVATAQPVLAKFARAIQPPDEVRAVKRSLDFARAVPGSILDAQGVGTGLTSRLPGTGTAISGPDERLRLRPDLGVLELTTTRSDLNHQVGLDTGEYLGVRLADLGFTGVEDFTVTVEVPDSPALEMVGQFGLYAGLCGDRVIRGGVLMQPDRRYSLFLVNTEGGIDRDLNQVGFSGIGDDLRFTLRRASGEYSLRVENLTRRSTNTLTIAPSNFLDGARDLHAGVFGANTRSDVSKTLTLRSLDATVWTRVRPGPPS